MQKKSLRVLLIEHDEAFARIVQELLAGANEAIGEVVLARSFENGLTLASGAEFDAVLLEFFLPDGAGLTNIALLKERSPRIPILAFGVADEETIAVEAVHSGAQDYLVKGQLSTRWLVRSIHYAIERQHLDLALLDAEEKYRSLFNHLVEGIFRTSPDGRYLMANSALAKIYGYSSPEELMSVLTDIGKRLYVQTGRREEFRRTMEQHDTITAFESQIYRKDGSTIWISENCHAIRDVQGRLLYYEGTVEDITQRRVAEEDLRHSEALYHSLVETLPQNIFRKDAHGCFTFANQQFCKTLGLPLEEIVGKTDYDFFPPDMAAKFQRDDQAVLKGKAIEVVEMNQPPGKPVAYVQVVKTPLRGAYGEIIGLQGIFWDITQQKLAEERVRQAQEDVRASETLYHSLVDVMPQSIFRKDMEGRYTFANQEFCRTLRRDLEQVLGKTIHDFLPKPLADQRVQDDLRVMESRLPFSQIEQSRFEGRDDQFIQVLKIPILDAGGNVTGLQGMFWDITELKTAEQRIRRANEELAASQEKLRRRNGEMENDLKMAGEIQAAMLPSHLPTFPKGVSSAESAFHFSHRYRPTKAVGGDFYHVMALSDTEAAVFLCDVAGHGVRSALVTAMIRALLEELRPFAGDPGQFLTKLNKDLGAILKNPDEPILTTAFYLVADSATDTLRFANAGHPKPILVRRKLGTVELLVNSNKKNQAALGVFEKITYQTSQVPFGGGDMVVLFTDGLYEVHNESGLYAQEMLTAVVQRHSQLSATKLFDKVLAEIRQFAGTHEFDDDVCLVGVERTEK